MFCVLNGRIVRMFVRSKSVTNNYLLLCSAKLVVQPPRRCSVKAIVFAVSSVFVNAWNTLLLECVLLKCDMTLRVYLGWVLLRFPGHVLVFTVVVREGPPIELVYGEFVVWVQVSVSFRL